MELSAGASPFQHILNLASKAFQRLFKNGGYKPEDLKNVREYRKLIGATAQMISNEIPQEVPQEMKDYLKKDAFIFSGMRTHAQLAEAHSLLKNDKGEIRPYYQFEQDMLKLNEKYNRNYLEAEYLFAKSSAQSAANWANYSDDTSRYLLQYRTTGDERVRESHAALNRTTLPKDAGFWQSYYPPNGWRCRCTVVEVRAARYEASDEAKANAEGEKATTQIGKNGKNKLEMFRFNPGLEKRIFPKQNAYYPKHCKGGKVDLSRLIGHAFFVLNAENDKCKAGKIVKEMAGKTPNDAVIQSRKSVKEWMDKQDFPIKVKSGIDFIDEYTLAKSSIKTMISKWYPDPEARDEWVKNIKKELPNATYYGWAADEMIDGVQKHPDVKLWLYAKTKIGNAEAVICIKFTKNGIYKPYSLETLDEYKKIPNTNKEKPQ